jgi:GNAT superfamily N-acetyltransferase
MAIFRVEKLAKDHDRSRFSSGTAALDRYLARQARQDQHRNVAAIFVLIDVANDRIAGYYTLSASDVALDALPEQTRKRLPRYSNVPTALLGRLAVDQNYRGHGLGRLLLADALRLVVMLQVHIGTWGINVSAIDDNARAFYKHFGFVEIPDEPYNLFLPLESIRPLLDADEIPPTWEDVRMYDIEI